ncbi:helix-turn-helix domain-containing protein [Providencia rettgeri]
MNSANKISNRVAVGLKQHRIESGLTAFELAKMSGIKSEQQLYRYEKGINKIGVSDLVAALRAMKVDVGEFFEQIDKESLVTDGLVDIDKEKDYLKTQMVAEPSSNTY